MTSQTGSAPRWRPTGREAEDAAFVGLLMMLGLAGLGSVYGGTTYLIVSLIGVALGLAIAYLGVRLGAPWIFLSMAVLLFYFLLAGAVALRGDGGGPVPDLGTLRSLTDVALNGWKQLISIVPPIGDRGPLLALPYLLGLAGAVISYSIARRYSSGWLPMLPLIAVLAVCILLGSPEPYSLVIQGTIYFGVSALYVVARTRRNRVVVHATRRARWVGGIAMIALAGVAGLLVEPVMAAAGEQDRTVLRESIVPPFDPHDWVSPLAQLRHWEATGTGQGDQPLFSISPVPAGVVRIATMDAYDGTVYNVAGNPGPPRPGVDASVSGWFQPVGQTFPQDPALAGAPTQTYTVSIDKYRGIWLPMVGSPTSVAFDGPDANLLSSTLRINASTYGAVAGLTGQPNQGVLGTGGGTDSYTIATAVPTTDQAPGDGVVSASLTADPSISSAPPLNVSLPAATGPTLKALPDALQKLAGDTTGAFARASAIAAKLSEQSLSSSLSGPQPSVAGHSVKRLADMLASTPYVGDAEQFSALMALLLTTDSENYLPARVVVGVRHVPADGVVLGKDVTAWVEVGIQGYGWIPFFPTPAKPNLKTQKTGQTNKLPDPPPPPVSPHLKSVIAGGDTNPTDSNDKNSNLPADAQNALLALLLRIGSIAVVPLLLLGVPTVVLLLLKSRRRARRRSTGPGSQRIAAGWDEVIDWARDTGRDVPPRRTRLETAGSLAVVDPTVQLSKLAESADRAVFAPESPNDDEVTAYWADVATAQRRLVDGLPRWRRLWARVNPTSLRSPSLRRQQ